jgi:hypothetical protein
MLKKRDLSWKKGFRWVRQLEEARRICRKLDKEDKDNGYLSDTPCRLQVVHAFYKAKHVFGLSDKTPKGRKRNFGKITLGTIARELGRENRELARHRSLIFRAIRFRLRLKATTVVRPVSPYCDYKLRSNDRKGHFKEDLRSQQNESSALILACFTKVHYLRPRHTSIRRHPIPIHPLTQTSLLLLPLLS